MASDPATTTPTTESHEGFGIPLSTILKGFGVLAVIALVVIAMKTQSEAAVDEAWAAYGDAQREGFTIEALERAYDETSGSAAEPWVAFRLALTLWENGNPDDLARAEQVADEASARFPDHPAHGALAELLEVIREQRAFEGV